MNISQVITESEFKDLALRIGVFFVKTPWSIKAFQEVAKKMLPEYVYQDKTIVLVEERHLPMLPSCLILQNALLQAGLKVDIYRALSLLFRYSLFCSYKDIEKESYENILSEIKKSSYLDSDEQAKLQVYLILGF